MRGLKPKRAVQPIPPELLTSIDHASVFFRSPDAEGGRSAIVQASALGGPFRWDGVRDATARIARRYPRLSPEACRRAARLLRDIVSGRASAGVPRLREAPARWLRTPWMQTEGHHYGG